MRRLVSYLIFLAVAVAVGVPDSFGQATIGGSVPFNSYGGGPFDRINLSDLDVHFDIPVFSKAGRGLPFSYMLGYDSLVWTPEGSLGWQPASSWGWRGETQNETGYVIYATGTQPCGVVGNHLYYKTTYFDYAYFDRDGVVHPFGVGILGGCTYPSSANATADDGSGYTIYAQMATATVYDKAGHVLKPPMQTGSGSGTVTDTNGNQITFNGTTFTDTL